MMKKKRKVNNRGSYLYPRLNFLKFFVITCIFSVSMYVVIVYLFGGSNVSTTAPISGNSTFSRISFESSVWCKIDMYDNTHKTCTFNNLCWLPSEEQFIFLLGETSIFHGVTDWRDLAGLVFSSAAGHNRFSMKIAVISVPVAGEHPLNQYTIINEREWVYFLWRFKPDNIMHTVHDDLLPLFYVYDELCLGNIQACAEKYKLIFVDDLQDELAFDFYNLFSRESEGNRHEEKPVFLRYNWKQHKKTSICFTHASMGLPRTTLWYQYGFGKPQGTIEGSMISMSVLKRFANFMLKQMELSHPADFEGVSRKESYPSQRALYLSRSISRKILNEDEVIETTKSIFSGLMGNNSPLKVDIFNPAPNSSYSSGMKEMMKIVSRKPLPMLLFGMHSAALTVAAILCIGLKAENTDLYILELFPLGIDPAAVSPLRALVKAINVQDSRHIFYESWVNYEPTNSILPSTKVDHLVGGGDACPTLNLSTILPAVECCHNPEYLCRMFQNTVVDTKTSYPGKVKSLLSQPNPKDKAWGSSSQGLRSFREFKWFFPASVYHIQCLWNKTEDEGYLILTWTSPINLYGHLHHYSLTATLQLEIEGMKNIQKNEDVKGDTSLKESVDLVLKTPKTTAVISIPKHLVGKSGHVLHALVWIQCIVPLKYMGQLKHRSGLDEFHRCSLKL
ncbi:protein O-linked-mannose beta-1,4-N-acetylglucosaminyltransferase 2-like [Ischnura elegans]|uniref:protein O-linked-mannose beta-1,4-N-acetylglucosaminyltransferase 2-like n=1 Tax=Ischnura elegans TaxID=197161 RepID=UPI001ED86931|nr:protein O-linked-mannose beta-1,4-N-acetylglucosaminyltransferase 2-like [Ischnura elegans]